MVIQLNSLENILYPLLDHTASVQLIDYMGTDKSVINAARVSYLQDNQKEWVDKDRKLLEYLLKHNHGSTLEHSSMTFRVKMPLFIIMQVLRHRVGTSFNQSSRRYTEINENEVYVPTYFRVQSKNNKQASVEATIEEISVFGTWPSVDMWNAAATKIYEDAWRFAFNKYESLLSMGVSREQARGVLPVGQYGEFYFTLNLRSLFHFLELRLESHAQWEIQLMGKAMLELIEPKFPETVAVWKSLHPDLVK